MSSDTVGWLRVEARLDKRHGCNAARIGDVLDPYLARDRLILVGCYGHIQKKTMVAGEQIGLPSAPNERIAAAHHEAVAGVLGRSRIVGAHCIVEELKAADVAAIAPVEEQTAATLRRIDGLQDRDVGGEAHEPARIDGGLVEIDNASLRPRLWIDGKVRAALEALIRSDGPKGLTAGEGKTLRDVDLDPVGHNHLPHRVVSDLPERYPRPSNGMAVALIAIVSTLLSRGKLAM